MVTTEKQKKKCRSWINAIYSYTYSIQLQNPMHYFNTYFNTISCYICMWLLISRYPRALQHLKTIRSQNSFGRLLQKFSVGFGRGYMSFLMKIRSQVTKSGNLAIFVFFLDLLSVNAVNALNSKFNFWFKFFAVILHLTESTKTDKHEWDSIWAFVVTPAEYLNYLSI